MTEIQETRRSFIKGGLLLPVAGGAAAASQVEGKPSHKIELNSENPSQLKTSLIQHAIDELSKAGGGVLILASGTFVTGTVFLKSNVHIHIEQGVVWRASPDLNDFTPLDWGHNKDRQPWHLIYADGIENVAITGLGTIDGNGEAYWQPYEKKPDGSMLTPRWIKAKDKKVSPLIDLNRSRNIVFESLTVHTGGGWCIHCFDCDQVRMSGVNIINNIYSPNSDGVDLTGCRDVSISDCHIKTCDDAIVLKTLEDSRTCERVAVSNCVIETLCVGIKMGAGESFKDMRDFSATNCVFHGTSRFFALYSKRGGMLENITITNISGNTNAKLVFNRPIQLMVERDEKGVIGGIRNLVVSNLSCNTDGRLLVTCDEGGVMDNLTFRDITLDYPWVEDPKPINRGARSNQFPRQADHADANAARAAVVIKNASRVNLQNIVVNWPDNAGQVPLDWRHPERIENGTTRIHTYAYTKPYEADFHFLWAKDVKNLVLNNPFATSTDKNRSPYALENCQLL